METAWPRCPKCGRRWRAQHPACRIEVAPKSSETEAPAEPPPRIEGLAIDRLLGVGGFGAVFLAHQISDGRQVAVKVPKDEADPIMRLELEGDTLRRLAGVHAPALYGEPRLADGRPCLVMEFVAMPTLDRRLAEIENGMPLDELGRRGLSLLTGLRAIHALGLVHRDLKPENVFSTDLPTVTRIFDFGLVKTPAEAIRKDTSVGMFMGTPEYMAPEQLDASAPVDQRADIYAVGAVLYEMLTGRPPFWGNAAEVQQALANRRAPPPSRYVPGVPPALEALILRCLAKDPPRRFGNVDELIAAFETALEQASSQPAAQVPAPLAPATTKPAADAKAAAPARRQMAAVAVRGIAVEVLTKALVATGGQLAEVGRGSGVGLFGDKSSENPVRRAIDFADSLLARKICTGVVVDLTAIAVRKKPDGSDRYVSAAFARLLKQLETLPGKGLYLTAAAGELVPERRGETHAESGLAVALPPPREDDTLTVVRSAQAPLIGRASEIERLVSSAKAAIIDRRPGLATVIGEGGIGKSHLGAVLAEELRGSRRDAAVVELRIREPIDGEGEGNLRALLGRCFTLPEAPPADRGAELLAELGPSLWPVAALALGWMTPEAPELRTLSAAPGVLRATLSKTVGEALRIRARQRPLVLILDDVQLADDATLEAIEYASMAEAGAPLWVCVLSRPALSQMKPSWGERAGTHLRLEIGPLAAEAAGELARRLLHPVEHVSAAVLETLVAGTHGSPFLLNELVRGLKRDGIVRKDRKGIWYVAADELARMPDVAVTDWLAEREIGAMGPELVAHARLCSLLGTDFSEDELEGVLSELERADGGAGGLVVEIGLVLDPHVATRQLLTMGVFKRQRGGRATFRHTLLRGAVEKSVSEKMRAEVHAAGFRFYRAATSMEAAVRLPRLAFHAGRAGYSAEAAPIYLDLADRARGRHAYVEAETLYSRALGYIEEADLARRLLALRGRGFMRYRLSRRDAVDDLMAARSAAHDLGDHHTEIEIVLDAATALDWMVEYRKSRDLVNEAEGLLATVDRAARNDLLRATLLVGQGRALWRFSEGKAAIEKFRAAIALAEPLGDAGYEIRVISLLLLGDLLPYHGEIAEAERVFETVMSLCEQHGDQGHLMVAFLNRRQLWIGRRDLARALEDSRRSIQLAREIGFVQASFMGEYNLAELLYQDGDADNAWPHVRRAVELEEKRLSGIDRPVALVLEARLLTYLGRQEEARAVLTRIVASQAEAEQAGQSETLLLPSERVLLDLVDLCTRVATDEEWSALRKRADGTSVEQELIEISEMTALAMFRQGRAAGALAGLEEALRLAEKIPNVMERRLRRSQETACAASPVARTA